jgi:hypothetical protein
VGAQTRVAVRLRPPAMMTAEPRWKRALVVLLITLSVIVPAALGGLSYVWCAPMARALLRSCCPAAEQHHHGASIEQPCCESQRVAHLATFASHAPFDPWIGPAPLVCLLALAVLFAVGSEPPLARVRLRARQARAGPAPPLYLLNRSLLN